MTYAAIQSALEKRLLLLTPALPTAFPNATFTPTTGAPYQRCYLLPNTTQAPALDQKTHIERGIFQVSLYYPSGAGAGAATARAELLRAHFPAGLVLTQAGRTVRVSRPPSIASGMSDDGWHVVPVSIPFQSIQGNP